MTLARALSPRTWSSWSEVSPDPSWPASTALLFSLECFQFSPCFMLLSWSFTSRVMQPASARLTHAAVRTYSALSPWSSGGVCFGHCTVFHTLTPTHSYAHPAFITWVHLWGCNTSFFFFLIDPKLLSNYSFHCLWWQQNWARRKRQPPGPPDGRLSKNVVAGQGQSGTL